MSDKTQGIREHIEAAKKTLRPEQLLGQSELAAPAGSAAFDDDSQWGCEPDDEWCDTCGNLGVLICHCGGDLCVCMNQGEYPCPECG